MADGQQDNLGHIERHLQGNDPHTELREWRRPGQDMGSTTSRRSLCFAAKRQTTSTTELPRGPVCVRGPDEKVSPSWDHHATHAEPTEAGLMAGMLASPLNRNVGLDRPGRDSGRSPRDSSPWCARPRRSGDECRFTTDTVSQAGSEQLLRSRRPARAGREGSPRSAQ